MELDSQTQDSSEPIAVTQSPISRERAEDERDPSEIASHRAVAEVGALASARQWPCEIAR